MTVVSMFVAMENSKRDPKHEIIADQIRFTQMVQLHF